jgi:hypothetical protein
VGARGVGVRENEDIFLSEVRDGGQVGVKSGERDVHLHQFS